LVDARGVGYLRAAFVVGSKLGNVLADPVFGIPDFTLGYVKQWRRHSVVLVLPRRARTAATVDDP